MALLRSDETIWTGAYGYGHFIRSQCNSNLSWPFLARLYRISRGMVARSRVLAPASTGDAERSPAARELAATLGWDRVGAYHAGLTREERTAIEAWFFRAEDVVLLGTCAYGMP